MSIFFGIVSVLFVRSQKSVLTDSPIAVMVRLAAKEPNAAYITINLGEVYITEDIKEKSFACKI